MFHVVATCCRLKPLSSMLFTVLRVFVNNLLRMSIRHIFEHMYIAVICLCMHMMTTNESVCACHTACTYHVCYGNDR